MPNIFDNAPHVVALRRNANDPNVYLTTECPICKEKHTFTVPADGFFAWLGGELIQRALPSVSEDDRERLISGTCPKCWDTIGEEPEEEGEEGRGLTLSDIRDMAADDQYEQARDERNER